MTSICALLDGHRVVIGTQNKALRVWDVETRAYLVRKMASLSPLSIPSLPSSWMDIFSLQLASSTTHSFKSSQSILRLSFVTKSPKILSSRLPEHTALRLGPEKMILRENVSFLSRGCGRQLRETGFYGIFLADSPKTANGNPSCNK
jgi:hypothetical protein